MNARPSVSVCMATYNGAAYVLEQARSILEQLEPGDELVVCDDGSRDDTLALLRALGDARVKIHTFAANVGHVRNFERCLALARGEIVFLSDQDDVWKPGKVQVVLQCFAANARVLMVQHALSTMDAAGRTLAPLWNPLPAGVHGGAAFVARQLGRCQVFGCAVAVRRALLRVLLPFPAQAYAHDHWLAVAAGLAGRVCFINQPLVGYRQHAANVTPKKGLGWRRRVTVRVLMLQMMAIAAWRVRPAARRAPRAPTL
ncbi:glycosyltransferase family 2 protein [Azohydromonas lata]|uniref:Glycosyltransferase family 2 protein n=1 Tax=Azohydromonas lata TaxID=45677 RepID=A0ABU5IBP6_9BURK|nr:glycosyltransferase family 2 protein [Azohydromonas lata]MDZ5456524.1 glycosyltransferase family 2 protein [Azohydromonas lata]